MDALTMTGSFALGDLGANLPAFFNSIHILKQ